MMRARAFHRAGRSSVVRIQAIVLRLVLHNAILDQFAAATQGVRLIARQQQED